MANSNDIFIQKAEFIYGLLNAIQCPPSECEYGKDIDTIASALKVVRDEENEACAQHLEAFAAVCIERGLDEELGSGTKSVYDGFAKLMIERAAAFRLRVAVQKGTKHD